MKMYGRQELAKLCGVSTATIGAHIKRGVIPKHDGMIPKSQANNGLLKEAWNEENAKKIQEVVKSYKRGSIVIEKARTRAVDFQESSKCGNLFNSFIMSNARVRHA